MTSTARNSLSATNLANYHHLNCDLYLHRLYYDSRGGGARPEPTALTKAQFSRGLDWEGKLLSWLDEQGLLAKVLSGPLLPQELKDVIDFDERDHFFLAGVEFWAPNEALAVEFREARTEPVRFGLAKPDLIEITRDEEGGVTWRVIDAKASSSVKTSHHVQIFFYHLCLTHILPSSFTPSDSACIWLPPSAAPAVGVLPRFEDIQCTSVSLLQDSLMPFLFQRLPNILAQRRGSVEWHFNPLCQACPYEEEHRLLAVHSGAIGAMSNISLAEAHVLRTLLGIARSLPGAASPTSDIEDLHVLFSNTRSVDRIEKDIPSTMRKAKRILGVPPKTRAADNGAVSASPLVEAARTQQVQLIGRRIFTLPRHEDIAVVLSVILDPTTSGDGGVAAFNLSFFSSLPSVSLHPISGTASELVPSLANAIRTLLALRRTPRAQFYVFSTAERNALQQHIISVALGTSPKISPSGAGEMKHEGSLQDDIKLCIGALVEGASILATAFQPPVLSGALLDFLGRKGARRKQEYAALLERLGLDATGTVETMRVRLQTEVDRLKLLGNRSNEVVGGNMELGLLPRVVVLKREIERLVALPIAGYWDLPEAVRSLMPTEKGCASDEELFDAYVNSSFAEVKPLLDQRNRCMWKVLMDIRGRANTLLVNRARVLNADFMDVCLQPHLKKLFFMQQFEVLARLSELWQSRIDGCPDAPVVEYHGPSTTSGEHLFTLVSGMLDVPSEKDRAFYGFLMVEDTPSLFSSDLPPEALFDDLPLASLVFPLNRWTRPKWDVQRTEVRNSVRFADVRELSAEGSTTQVTLQIWSDWKEMPKMERGRRYRLSPRLVNFNLSKVLATLLEMDLRCDPLTADADEDHVPFIQLITQPRTMAAEASSELPTATDFTHVEAAIQSTFKELHSLGSEPAGKLLLKRSQRHATQRILSSRLAVIWGPPGTGKTYTIVASLLRLLEVQARQGRAKPQIIFLTAMTHAAIDACLSKLHQLIQCYKSIDGLPTRWLDAVKVEHVLNGNGHTLPLANTTKSHIYAGTVYQLYNFSKRRSLEVDCVVIDEAGQLSLGSAALALRSLSSTGRIVIAGDSEQLAPIVAAQYPRLETRLFGSILDCVMHLCRDPEPEPETDPNSQTTVESEDPVSSQVSTIVQLTENFRLNPDLGDFVSTIYARTFRPQKVQARQLAARLKSLSQADATTDTMDSFIHPSPREFLIALSTAMLREQQSLLRPPTVNARALHKSLAVNNLELAPVPISLALIRLRATSTHPGQMGYEAHVRGEAMLAVALVRWLRIACPEDDIFVATPHRIQRYAVREHLAKMAEDLDEELSATMSRLSLGSNSGNRFSDDLTDKVTVDTVERLQGSEASFVICLFSDTSSSSPSLNFLLERRRLNVAISRAKTLCILITSNEVLRPNVAVLAGEDSAKGYAFLRNFEHRAWNCTIAVDLDAL